MAGWIKLHRQIRDNPLWDEKPFDKARAWIDIILSANHEPNKFLLGNEVANVDRGSFITSEKKLMEKWGWSKCKVRAFLLLLENESMIVKKTDSKKTTLEVLNYGIYQDSETAERPQKDRKKTALRLQKDTNKNEKNEKNEKKDIYSGSQFNPPTIEEVIAYCLERNNNVNPNTWHDFYSSKGWMVGKNKMKDWKAAVRTWEHKDKQRGQSSQPNRPKSFDAIDQWYDMTKGMDNE